MMFGRRGRTTPPPNTPFLHDDRCKTKDAQPEWFDSVDGRWERVCSCGTEYRVKESEGELTPTSRAAEPAKSAHEHHPGCAGTEVDAMVVVEFDEDARGWRSYCQLCTSSQWYHWAPDLVEETAAGDLVPVRRRGSVFFSYELAREQVPG
jgi:hypothetical protein